jgi:hypothetical protein
MSCAAATLPGKTSTSPDKKVQKEIIMQLGISGNTKTFHAKFLLFSSSRAMHNCTVIKEAHKHKLHSLLTVRRRCS